MKKSLLFAGAVSLMFSAVAAPEFADYSSMNKAGIEAQKAKEFEKMFEIYSSWAPKATSDFQKYNCFFGASRALREMKKFDEAMKLTDEYIASNPPSIHKSAALLVKGVIHVAKNENDKALVAFEDVLKEAEMHDYVKYQALGHVMYQYFSVQNYERCVEAADKLIATEGKLGNIEHAYYYATTALLDGKKFAECEKRSKDALAIVKNPAYKARISYSYAQCLLQREEEDEAVKYLQECVKLEPNSWRARNAKKTLQELE